MALWHRLLHRTKDLLARARRERDLDEEIRFHIESATESYRERGLSEPEARRAALVDFGGPDAAKEGVRDAWAFALLAELATDVRLALRGLRKRPAYAATVIVTVLLATGAAGAIFSALWAVIYRPLPYRDDGQLLLVQYTQRGSTDTLGLSPPEVADFQAGSRSLDGLSEYHNMNFTLLGHGEPRRVRTGVVSANYFDLLGVRPLLGRDFVAGDDAAAARPVLLLSYRFWRDELGGDPALVGADFTMNDKTHTVIGVLPPLPPAPDENDVYMPVAACPFRSGEHWAHSRVARGLVVVARLRAGFDAKTATADLELLTRRLAKSYPDAYPERLGLRPRLVPVRESMTAAARPTLWLLAAAALTVVLLVCANLLNLTLAQLARRESELALRLSVGASRGRIARQLATEGAVLALIGGGCGMLFGLASRSLLAGFLVRLTPRASEIRFDLLTVGFVLGLSLLIGLAIGLVPALRRQRSLLAALRADGATATVGGRSTRTRDALVVLQVASSCVLLIGAGLLLRSLWNLERVQPGFRHPDVLTLAAPMNWTKYGKDDVRLAYSERLLQHLRGVPGVEAVALADNYPLSADGLWNRRVAIGKTAPDPAAPGPTADFRTVSPEYFDTVGIPLLAGRQLQASDRDAEHAVALINATFAHQLFGERDPLGQLVTFGGGTTAWTIVGVVADVHQRALGEAVQPEIYAPIALRGGGASTVLVRARSAAALVPALRAAIRAVDPEQPILDIRTLEEARAASLAAPRAVAALLGIAATLALVIAATGLAGILAYSLGQRQREFGIRIALGSTRLGIARLVLGRTGGLVGSGLVLGLAVALFTARGLSSMLFGLAASDPQTYATVVAVLAVSATVACLPALRRAITTAPSLALRAL